MGNATIRDVAREAAVSVASASRALSGHPAVLPATRERIAAAAARLHYVPHAGARSLSMAKAHTIGVMLPDLHGEFFSEIVRGMDREAHRLGFQLLLSNMHADMGQAAAGLGAMRGRVDGLLVMAPDLDPDLLARTMPRALPAVLLNTRPTGNHRTLQVENHDAAVTMVRHLIATGRRRVVHVAGPEANRDAQERCAGYRHAMREAGLDAHVRIIAGDFTEAAGAAAASQIARDRGSVEAVFAANDMMAIGCMLGLRDAGIALPGEIALAGFDDIPAARYGVPALTTMRINVAELGVRAVQRLVATIRGEPDEASDVERLVPQIVIRDSTRNDMMTNR